MFWVGIIVMVFWTACSGLVDYATKYGPMSQGSN
jgi:hypothetical protein